MIIFDSNQDRVQLWLGSFKQSRISSSGASSTIRFLRSPEASLRLNPASMSRWALGEGAMKKSMRRMG